MRPLVVLLGIVMGSTVSIAVALLLTGVVFLLLPEYGERLADERRPLMVACLLSVVLAGVAIASFYGELRTRAWRFAAHAALMVVSAIAMWTYFQVTGDEALLATAASSGRQADRSARACDLP